MVDVAGVIHFDWVGSDDQSGCEGGGSGAVVYEPDGNIPPDFALGGNIAVEARRLNHNLAVGGRPPGAEGAVKSFRKALAKVCRESGPPDGNRSWFVHGRIRRPLPKIPSLRQAVKQFRENLPEPPREICLRDSGVLLRFVCATRAHGTLLIPGGLTDRDVGAFRPVEKLSENLKRCIAEKTSKIEDFRDRYAEWWLVFEDRIAWADLDRDEVVAVSSAIGGDGVFGSILLLDPDDSTRWVDLLGQNS